jgi:hypothetical protein
VIALIAGVVVTKREGNDVILQFNASVRGRYTEPGYVHFRRLVGGIQQIVHLYWSLHLTAWLGTE